ncbi:hypothetical protein VP01_2144g2 [Puccinia sorghi]|uniref:Uncharacterized protein n=1 Tax=Puccinia sorghi TaxID=27349 RepID=A0A0L6V9M3_9BASI|nr:hypothetical protein VP01_2144g2 [Puccinia sorghi]
MLLGVPYFDEIFMQGCVSSSATVAKNLCIGLGMSKLILITYESHSHEFKCRSKSGELEGTLQSFSWAQGWISSQTTDVTCHLVIIDWSWCDLCNDTKRRNKDSFQMVKQIILPATTQNTLWEEKNMRSEHWEFQQTCLCRHTAHNNILSPRGSSAFTMRCSLIILNTRVQDVVKGEIEKGRNREIEKETNLAQKNIQMRNEISQCVTGKKQKEAEKKKRDCTASKDEIEEQIIRISKNTLYTKEEDENLHWAVGPLSLLSDQFNCHHPQWKPPLFGVQTDSLELKEVLDRRGLEVVTSNNWGYDVISERKGLKVKGCKLFRQEECDQSTTFWTQFVLFIVGTDCDITVADGGFLVHIGMTQLQTSLSTRVATSHRVLIGGGVTLRGLLGLIGREDESCEVSDSKGRASVLSVRLVGFGQLVSRGNLSGIVDVMEEIGCGLDGLILGLGGSGRTGCSMEAQAALDQ